ncbi:MAG: SDR family NAD(P)-dependent oxidoreductase [Myxococcales bacterium]|nr:SDR family NAD(P)-dependent oxidoreductase [Myxococcales bacterium]
MVGRVIDQPKILVTGATDGIGRQTALELARRGALVILHGRSDAKLAATREMILAEVADARLDAVRADLSGLDEVRELAAEVGRRYPALDVLLNNAGVYMKARELSRDGLEKTMAINHDAPFLLSHLLLDNLRRARQGRVVNVASIAHARGRLDLEDLDLARGWSEYGAYAASKLANVLFTVELARRLEGTPVTVNALHPGVVSTKLLLEGFNMRGGDSLAEGAATSVTLALDPDLADVTGRYFSGGQLARTNRAADDDALVERFYLASAKAVGVEPLPKP